MSRRSFPTRAAVVTAAAVAGLGVGVRLNRSPTSTPAPKSVAVPRADARLVGGGLASRSASAVSVACRFVRSGQALLDSDDGGVDAVLAPVVAASALPRIAADTRRQLVKLRGELADATGPIRWRQAVLAVRVDSSSATTATVSVWHVGVLSAPGVAPPQSHWATSQVDLVTDGDSWKVTAETVVAGPAPVGAGDSAPVDDAQLEATLDGYVGPEQAAS